LKDRRVVIVRDPEIPLDIGAAVAGRARWLRDEVERLDAELDGIDFPYVEVMPVCWVHSLRDGTGGPVPGRVTISEHSDRRLVVQVTMPALLEYDDDLLTGVLAHEYLHVVHMTIDIDRVAAAAPPGSPVRWGLQDAANNYDRSWRNYRRLDARWQVSPRNWLSDRLQRLADLVERPNPRVEAAIERIKQSWVTRGLPVEKINLVMTGSFNTRSLDTRILERAIRLREQTPR